MRGFVLVASIAMIFSLARPVGAAPGSATPPADACTVEPLDGSELEAIVARGFEPAPQLETSSEPATAAGLLAIFEVLRASVACTNANQPMSAFALYTDRYLAQRFSGPDGRDELGHLLAASTRSPGLAAPEDQLVLLSVADAVRYPGGRIGAMVTTANAEEVFVDLVVFADTGDGWKIDQVVLSEELPAPATPAVDSRQP